MPSKNFLITSTFQYQTTLIHSLSLSIERCHEKEGMKINFWNENHKSERDEEKNIQYTLT